jgi:hypothetical protein
MEHEETALVVTTQERIVVKNMLALLDYSHLVKAIVIAYMCGKEKYYKIEGYANEIEFFRARAGISAAQGKKYKKIGQKFLEMFPLRIDNVKSTGQNALPKNSQSTGYFDNQHALPMVIDDQTTFNNIADFVSEIGLEKFYEMVRFDIDIAELANEEMVTLPNGDVISIEEIKLQSAKQLTLQLSDAQTDLENLNAKLKSERARHEEQLKLMRAENDHLKEKVDDARELEKLYGPKGGKFTDKKQRLDDAYGYFDLFRQNLSQADIKPGDAEVLIERFSSLLNLFKNEAQRYATEYAQLLEER